MFINNYGNHKIYLLFAICVLMVSTVFSQSFPVAANDYKNVHLGDKVTINVTNNDYHPDGLSFYVFLAPGASSFTDSTITYDIYYDQYYNIVDTLKFNYTIKDENGQLGFESIGKVFLNILDNKYYNYLDFNNIRARVQASGMQFYPGPIAGVENENTNVFEFPKNSGKKTIFNSTLWIGGLDEENNLHLSAERYRQIGIDYWPGPISKQDDVLSIDTSTVINWQKVWTLTKEEVVYHKLYYWEDDYQPIENIANWPAHGNQELNQPEYLAPFVDVDGDGEYIPLNGDYPLIRGDQCIYFIINELRSHDESEGDSLGLEIHGMAYEFEHSGNNPMDNTVFYSYKIFNRSNTTYHDAYIGLFTDFEIGYAWDDYVGCDVQRGTFYGFNGDSIDGTENNEEEAYENETPAQGIVILGGPLMDENNIDDADDNCDESINGVGFGDGTIDNERLGMTKFLWYGNGSGAQGDPTTAMEYYGYLKANWKDGTAMEYGGNGHFSSGAYGPAANFMFPGLSDPCFWGTDGEEPFGPVNWTETSAGNLPSDRRGLSVMGPFTFEAGSMEKIDIAYVAAFAENGETSVETMLKYIDDIKEKYYQNSDYFGYQWLGSEEIKDDNDKLFTVFPNPAYNVLSISSAETNTNSTYIIRDLMGKILLEGSITSKTESINISKLKTGIFIISIVNNQKIMSKKFIKY
ncbi:MAG: hypothetical protein C0595_13605 [Marinilabiliales bacterium]|nr:MAG: hypothetical protein C0595_13605 [Marinilabiliales bacterium]